MAKKSNKDQDNKGKKGTGKGKELSFFGKIKRFFGNLKNELKLVVWPDRTEVKQTTIAVLIIVAATVVLVFVVDSLMNGVLRLSGFDTAPVSPELNPTPTTVQAETAETTAAEASVQVTPPAETSKSGD